MRNDSLEECAERAICAYRMLEGTDFVLVGLSGGADSVAMTHYLRFTRGIGVAACHMNHNLRGRESERDEDFVRELCRMWDLPLFVESVDVEALAKKRSVTLEEAGRDARYRFFATAARRCGALRVATAHTASDNLETMLLNLTRGTGRRGLSGIPPVRQDVPEAGEGFPPLRLIRPLIECSREQVEDYCRRHGLSYVVDSSNMRDDYSRNKVRHRIIPVLRGMNPDVVRTASHTAQVLREEDELLDGLAREALDRSRLPDGGLGCALLSDVPRPLLRRALADFLAENGVSLSGRLLEEALAMAASGSGKRMLSPGRYLLVRGGRLWVETPPAPAGYFETAWDGDWPAEAAVPGGGVLTGRICEKEALQPDQKVYKNLLYLALDYDKIKGKILVRQRRAGDSVALQGRGGTKSLKKLLIERKLTAYEKSVLPVLSDSQGVIALWGVGVDRRVAPGGSTRRLLLVEARGTAKTDQK